MNSFKSLYGSSSFPARIKSVCTQQGTVAGVASRDRPGTYRGDYRPLLMQNETVIAVGTSRYYTDDTRGTLDREYHNLWVLRFAGDGRCGSFTEWYMRVPATDPLS